MFMSNRVGLTRHKCVPKLAVYELPKFFKKAIESENFESISILEKEMGGSSLYYLPQK